MCHALNSLCTCGGMFKMAATHCATRRTHYAHLAICNIKWRQLYVPRTIRTHCAHVAPCVKWRLLIVPIPCTCGAMCKMAATHCNMCRTHYAHVAPCVKWQQVICATRRTNNAHAHAAPCVKWRQLIVTCAKLTVDMWRHV